jgi:hypothetical protein
MPLRKRSLPENKKSLAEPIYGPTLIQEPGELALYNDGLRAGRPSNRSSKIGRDKGFSLFHSIQSGSGTHPGYQEQSASRAIFLLG